MDAAAMMSNDVFAGRCTYLNGKYKCLTHSIFLSAIFYYRDCLSRIVLERCPESSRTVVDLMMGDRNRELSTNCRDYNRDQCSGVPSLQSSLFIVVVSTLLVALFR